jgi:hypothetical protein
MSCRFFWVATVLIVISISAVYAEQDSGTIYGDSLCPAKIIDKRFVFSLKVYKNKVYGIVANGNYRSIAIYSFDGILIDSIIISGLNNPDSAFLIGSIYGSAFDKKGNIWLTTKTAPIVIDKKRRVRETKELPQHESIGSFYTGKGNDVILFSSFGFYLTPDFGISWKHIKGLLPEIKLPVRTTLAGDTIRYDLAWAEANGVFLDKSGRYWAGSRIGLIYSDDDLENWYVGDSTAFTDESYTLRTQNTIIGKTSNDELIIWALSYRLWIKSIKREPKLIKDFLDEYPFDKQTDYIREFRRPVLSGKYLFYIDGYSTLEGGGCFPAKKWIESFINLSDDLGNTWKKYGFGKDVEISDVSVLGNSVFVTSNKGLLMIPLNCFH